MQSGFMRSFSYEGPLEWLRSGRAATEWSHKIEKRFVEVVQYPEGSKKGLNNADIVMQSKYRVRQSQIEKAKAATACHPSRAQGESQGVDDQPQGVETGKVKKAKGGPGRTKQSGQNSTVTIPQSGHT